MKSYIKLKLIGVRRLPNMLSSLIHWILLYHKFEEFRQQFIQFVDEKFINFPLINFSLMHMLHTSHREIMSTELLIPYKVLHYH